MPSSEFDGSCRTLGQILRRMCHFGVIITLSLVTLITILGLWVIFCLFPPVTYISYEARTNEARLPPGALRLINYQIYIHCPVLIFNSHRAEVMVRELIPYHRAISIDVEFVLVL